MGAHMDGAAAQVQFKQNVHRHFNSMRSRGVGENEAAALAIQLATGVVEPPVDIRQLTRLLESPPIAISDWKAAEDAARQLFSSPETLSISVAGAGRSEGAGRAESEAVRWPEEAPKPRPPSRDDFQELVSFLAAAKAHSEREGDGLAPVIQEGSSRMLARFARNSSSTGLAGPMGVAVPLSALLANPWLNEPESASWVPKIGEVASSLPDTELEGLLSFWAGLSEGQFATMVEAVQHYVTLHLYEAQTLDIEVEAATKLLSFLSQANERTSVVPFTAFYNDAVNNGDFNIAEDYRRWKSSSQAFSFCRYSFIYDPGSKSRILQLENDKQMYNEFQDALLRSWLFSATYPFLLLRVRRSPYLVNDTLRQVESASSSGSLKKPLKVQFIGEEGVDEGGITKEFFQLLLRDLFDPSYGMFVYDDATRLYWFQPSQLDLEQEFRLIGIMIGLAIYNSQLLELAFPHVLYRKLVGQEPALEDVKEIFPEIHNSLKQILEYPGDDLETSFGLTFEVEYEAGFGEIRTETLGGHDPSTPVTRSNRAEFVQLYVKNLLVDRIRSQYDAFASGFYHMCQGPVLSMFRAKELEEVVCGSHLLDFDELERHAHYDDGFTRCPCRF